MTTLSERIAQPDLINLPDWRVTEILNTPDATLPEIVELKTKSVGPGAIMQAIGPEDGAEFLDNLEALSVSVPKVRWAMHIIKAGGLDVSDSAAREQIDFFVAQGILTEENGKKIKAITEVRRYPSWSEHHGILVTARAVGLARGGKE
jgi:hypothetical protein